jgi:membrane-associated phospholipid phosphatase
LSLQRIAKIISYLFVPPFMNLFIFVIFAIKFEKGLNSYLAIIISALFGVILPIIIFMRLRRQGQIANDDATIKEEREIPYIYAVIFSFLGVLITGWMQLNPNIIMLWMIYLVSSIFILNINRFWKISAHTLGVGLALGASSSVNEYYTIILIVIMFIVGFARLVLKVHTFSQVILGGIVGTAISFYLIKLLDY